MSRPPQEPTGAQHTAHAWKRPSTHVVSPLAPMAPSAKMMAEVTVASPQTYSWNTHTHFLARYRNGYCIMSHKLTAARGGQRSQHSVRGQHAQGRAAQNGSYRAWRSKQWLPRPRTGRQGRRKYTGVSQPSQRRGRVPALAPLSPQTCRQLQGGTKAARQKKGSGHNLRGDAPHPSARTHEITDGQAKYEQR